MTAVSRFSLSLRISHPSMSAADIAAAIQRKPDIAQTVGDARGTPKGTPLFGVYRNTFCTFPIEKAELSALEATLAREATALDAVKPQLLNIAATGGRAEFFIGVFLEGNDGFTLAAELQSRLAALGIDLAFDLYDRNY